MTQDVVYNFQKRVAILFKKRGAKNVQRARDPKLGLDLAMDEILQSGEQIKSGVKCIVENEPIGQNTVKQLYDDIQKNLKFSGMRRGYIVTNGSFLREAGVKARELNDISDSINIVLIGGSDLVRFEQRNSNNEISVYGTTFDKLSVSIEKQEDVVQSSEQITDVKTNDVSQNSSNDHKASFLRSHIPKTKIPDDVLLVFEILLSLKDGLVTYAVEETETILAIAIVSFIILIVAIFWIIHAWGIPIPTGHGSILFLLSNF
jgi:hypothetical protein